MSSAAAEVAREEYREARRLVSPAARRSTELAEAELAATSREEPRHKPEAREEM